MTLFRLAAVAVLAFGALLAPGGAAGQSPGKVYRLGIIYHGEGYAVLLDGLRQGLHEAGLDEGKQIVLDVPVTRGELKAVEAAARELERDKVDLLYTVATSVSLAAMHATTHTPPAAIRSRRGWLTVSRGRAGEPPASTAGRRTSPPSGSSS